MNRVNVMLGLIVLALVAIIVLMVQEKENKKPPTLTAINDCPQSVIMITTKEGDELICAPAGLIVPEKAEKKGKK